MNVENKTKYSGAAHFVAKLESWLEWAEENHLTGVLLKVSLDNFANIMALQGPDNAEVILADITQKIRDELDEHEFTNRIGINVLAIALLGDDARVTSTVQRITDMCADYINPETKDDMRLACSMGSVRFPSEAHTADDAMNKSYMAVENARAHEMTYHADYSQARKGSLAHNEKMEALRQLQKAVNEGRMLLAYQPIVTTDTGSPMLYECLMRIRKENGSIVTAGPMIPIAEETGYIEVLDQKVLEIAVKELEKYKQIQLSINVSSLTAASTDWIRLATKLLKDESVAERLMVEITETAAQNDLKQTAYFVAALQALGCSVALDDFGAGYTSFRQLKSLSVDMIKIDGAYVKDLANNSENQIFIRTLLDFNHSYGFKTVAECVESGEVAKILMDMDVEYLQGFYFGAGEIEPEWRNTSKSH